MRVLVREKVVVVVADGDAEREQLGDCLSGWRDHGFRCYEAGGSLVLAHVGPWGAIRTTPINVTSRHADPGVRLISNFAATPFELDGERYASVEGFWQCLRTTDPSRRREIAALSGAPARRAGQELGAPATLTYAGRTLTWGAADHWDLMRLACRAKFTQAHDARNALLATRPRPLEHRMRHDSRSIPGVIMAGIWTGLREELALLAARGGAGAAATS